MHLLERVLVDHPFLLEFQTKKHLGVIEEQYSAGIFIGYLIEETRDT